MSATQPDVDLHDRKDRRIVAKHSRVPLVIDPDFDPRPIVMKIESGPGLSWIAHDPLIAVLNARSKKGLAGGPISALDDKHCDLVAIHGTQFVKGAPCNQGALGTIDARRLSAKLLHESSPSVGHIPGEQRPTVALAGHIVVPPLPVKAGWRGRSPLGMPKRK